MLLSPESQPGIQSKWWEERMEEGETDRKGEKQGTREGGGKSK